MYRLAKVIANENPQPSLLAEVAFSPDGNTFAVTFQENDELHLFDTATLARVRTWCNPVARLDQVHGLLQTANHVIVSNVHGRTRPSRFNVYRRNSPDDAPIATFDTPGGGLVEAHSLALQGDRLVAAYCDSSGRTGGLVSYRFDDETGVISGPLTVVEECFGQLGDPKGVTFNSDGSQLIVSFESDQRLSWLDQRVLGLKLRRHRVGKSPLGIVGDKLREQLAGRRDRHQLPKPVLHNGLAVFDIGADGRISARPVQVQLRESVCRLENVHCVGDTCVISDTVNHRVYVYDLVSDPQLEHPVQVITDGLWLPHGAKLSPDKKLLVITNFSLNMWKDNILWRSWAVPRRDHILVFARVEPAPADLAAA